MFKFYEHRKTFFAISIAIFVVGIIMLFINGVSLDIQFKGGTILKYTYENEIDENAVAQLASDTLGVNVTTQKTTNFTDNTNQVVLNITGNEGMTAETQDELFTKLQEAFPDNNLSVSETSTVDPFIGAEFLRKGLLAIGLASALILLYVWFRFRTIRGLSAGVAALIALLHDILMVFFTFIIFNIPLNDGFIAVMLTILGYSINDTIVIYDRIRENDRLNGGKMQLVDLADLSLNECFTRTLNTSLSTFISMAVVLVMSLVFHLTSIFNFALPMLVGIVAGCYSTMFIACPVWVMWNNHKAAKNPVPAKNAKGKKAKK